MLKKPLSVICHEGAYITSLGVPIFDDMNLISMDETGGAMAALHRRLRADVSREADSIGVNALRTRQVYVVLQTMLEPQLELKGIPRPASRLAIPLDSGSRYPGR